MLPNKLRQVFIYLDGQLREVCVWETLILFYFIKWYSFVSFTFLPRGAMMDIDG